MKDNVAPQALGTSQDTGATLAFETRLSRLESLAADIKRADINLDEAMSDFEEGIKLVRNMTKELDSIEGKIQILMNDSSDGGAGAPQFVPFSNADASTGTSGAPRGGTRQ